ncbi:MAG: hypothetical protein JWL72_2418 [Ilumatobacteraceae bacterium]|nr:hypothetical protein [Ilumatobacteraceae bacterium]
MDLNPGTDRYLSFAEREEIALLRAQGGGVRSIAREIGQVAVDGVARAAPQRCDSWRQARVSGVGRAMESRPCRAAAEGVQAG